MGLIGPGKEFESERPEPAEEPDLLPEEEPLEPEEEPLEEPEPV